MKYLLVVTIFMLIFAGCSDLRTVENISKEYPNSKIYRICGDEYIVIDSENVFWYIETDLESVDMKRKIRNVTEYTTTKHEEE